MFLFLPIITVVISFILLVFNWRINKNATYLSLLFIIFASYGITHYFTLYGKSTFWLAICYTHISAFWLLPGPLLYFYVRGTLTDQLGLSWKDSWHFLPALVHLIGILPYLLQPFSFKLEVAQSIIQNMDNLKNIQVNWLYPSVVSFFMRTGLLIGYTLYTSKMLWDFKPSKKEMSQIPHEQYQITLKYLVLLHACILIAALGFLFITLVFSNTKVSSELVSAMPVHYISGIAFLLMSSSLLFFPEVLYGMPISRPKLTVRASRAKLKVKAKTGKPTKSVTYNLTEQEEDPFKDLADQILKHLEKKKPYLHPNFSLSDLAQALKVPQHHVSYCFNAIIKVKFTEIKTQLRVAHAKELLQKGASTELSIDGIGRESGFASRSNFYSAFKAETGLTPNEFLGKQ
jgi:AraC-like DNA-binding protein